MSQGEMNQKDQARMKTHAQVTGGGSALKRYEDQIVGSRSWRRLLYFEFCMIFAGWQCAAGLFLRKLFWPRLFGSSGSGVLFGSGVVLRHPGRIHLGDRVVISEGCILDARYPGQDKVLVLGDDVNLANDVMISAKQGTIDIGARCGIGAKTIIHSVAGNPVSIGNDVVIGPMCYLAGGGNYNIDRLDVPMSTQGIKFEGGIHVADDVWLGARVTVLDGVSLATGSVAAAGAVVTKDVPELAIVAGMPAKVVKTRGQPRRQGAGDA